MFEKPCPHCDGNGEVCDDIDCWNAAEHDGLEVDCAGCGKKVFCKWCGGSGDA